MSFGQRLCFFLFSLSFILFSCSPSDKEVSHTSGVTLDPHSYSRPLEARTDSLHLDLVVNFQERIVYGVADHYITAANDADSFIVDADGLQIEEVLVDGSKVEFFVGEHDDILGEPVRIAIQPSSKQVRIRYRTDTTARAFLWVEPEQTADKTAPFLFTQGQAVLTRSWIPCQDSPGIRFPYTAKVSVPDGMLALMSANNPFQTNDSSIYHFQMELPVPAYLIALAVGNLTFTPLGDRTGVYSEPGISAACAYEFAEMERMVDAAEELYGPYRWGRYDIIILPPSFPFGGMENPRLTFATPTIIAGDRSLTSLIAHELAHSWSGNLVTNATWNDFWLNEGFTTYFERRIMEALYGKEYADMLAVLGFQDLEEDIADLGPESEDTRLKLDLQGRDPDDGLTDVAYEKGALLLVALENTLGRERFDAFLTDHFNDLAFQTVTTEQFIERLNAAFPELASNGFPLNDWIFGTGLPEGYPRTTSSRFIQVDSLLENFNVQNILPDASVTDQWSTHEWLRFLRGIDVSNRGDDLGRLDAKFQLSESGNSEVAAIWLQKNIEAGRTGNVQEQLESFLVKVGRRKFLMPLYRALLENGQIDVARGIFAKAGPNYHAVSFHSVEHLLQNYQ